jgi:replication-associated recombination protein RarA
VRALREGVRVLPFSSKHKVYIVDEVHMLTKEAFNALLKTLEEPPAHVIFILATTELDKVPETILSRCQVFSFHSVSFGSPKRACNASTKAGTESKRRPTSGAVLAMKASSAPASRQPATIAWSTLTWV